jgi:hypothetical protein
LVVVGLTKLFAREHIVARSFSNTWHIELLVHWRNLFIQKLWTWWWAWFAWPASFHLFPEWFNPENQFLQIGIEFGLVGMILWIVFWLWLVSLGPWLWYQTGRHYSLPKNFYRLYNDSKKSDHAYLWLLAAMGCGFIALTISWLVLHSYVDRMIVYPTALLTGLLCSFLSWSDKQLWS